MVSSKLEFLVAFLARIGVWFLLFCDVCVWISWSLFVFLLCFLVREWIVLSFHFNVMCYAVNVCICFLCSGSTLFGVDIVNHWLICFNVFRSWFSRSSLFMYQFTLVFDCSKCAVNYGWIFSVGYFSLCSSQICVKFLSSWISTFLELVTVGLTLMFERLFGTNYHFSWYPLLVWMQAVGDLCVQLIKAFIYFFYWLFCLHSFHSQVQNL